MGTIVGAGVDVLFAPAFPAQVGIMLAVRLIAQPDELTAHETHELAVQIRGPDGEAARASDGSEIPTLRFQFQATVEQQLVPGWLMTPMFALGLQWEAVEEGTYTLVTSLDDTDGIHSPMHVLPVAAQPGGR